MLSLPTNHPKLGYVGSVNGALSPRREAAASPSAAAPAPATVGRDALAPIRAAMGS